MRETPRESVIRREVTAGFIIQRTWTETLCPDCTEEFIHDSFWGDPPTCNGECWTFGDQIAARESQTFS
jgi:hypothetical protein